MTTPVNKQPLRDAIEAFTHVLMAATVPSRDGGRVIPDHFGSALLSDATDHVCVSVLYMLKRILACAPTARKLPPGIRLEQAASPNGPWRPIPDAAARVFVVPMRMDQSTTALFAVLHRLVTAIAFPGSRWNRLQAQNPGGDHPRYRAGDVLPQEDIELVASAERLLELVDESQLPIADQLDIDPIETAKAVRLSFQHMAPTPRSVLTPSDQQQDTKGDEQYEFRLEGGIWRLAYEGKSGEIPRRDAGGLSYIQYLIRNPHHYVFVVELIANVDGHDAVKAEGIGEEILDPKAMRKIRERYNFLASDLEQAQRDNDEARGTRAQKEIDDLKEQTLSACALGGKIRRVGDGVERLRKRALAAITRAVAKIDERLPLLAVHLDHSIDTGRFLAYRPDRDLHWDT